MGLALALITRILLLLSLAWIVRLTAPLFAVLGHAFSGRDLILLGGGLFLLAKATHEIHQKMEGETGHASARVAPSFTSVIVQILLLDIVFSLDSVITAVGMVEQIGIMIAAVVVAVGFMLIFAAPTSAFVERHPTIKVLALSFLLLIGITLVAEGWGQHIGKGYIYFAMAFSVFVELEAVSKYFEEDAGKLHKSFKVVGVPVITGAHATIVLQPGKQPLDLPASLIAAQFAMVLRSGRLPSRSMRGDDLHAPTGSKSVDFITVIGFVADQPLRQCLSKTGGQNILD